MYESAFERKLCDYIKALGGKAYKWVSPGAPGVPDRIAILPGDESFYRRSRGRGCGNGLSVRQKKVIGTLEGLGCTVWRISDLEDLKARLSAL